MNTSPMYDGERESLEEYYRFIESCDQEHQIEDYGRAYPRVVRYYDNEAEPTPQKPAPLVKWASPSDLDGATLITFHSFEAATKRDDTRAGAILVNMVDADTECGMRQQWIPKTLCSNLDLEANTVWVYTPFVVEQIKEYRES